MTEWGVVGVIVALVGLLVSVITPMLKLNTSIVKLTVKLANIENGVEEFMKRYVDHLNEIRQNEKEIRDDIDNHEHRITILEARD